MYALNIITLLLIIVGGVNWGLVGLLDVDLVATIFGGRESVLSRIVYILVGLSAVWQLVPFVRTLSDGEVRSERNVH